MSGFGMARLKVEGGPFDPEHELPDHVYEMFTKRAQNLNWRGLPPQCPEREALRRDIGAALMRSRQERSLSRD